MPNVVAVRHGGPWRSPKALPVPASDRFSPSVHRSRPLFSRPGWRLPSALLLMLLAPGAALAQSVESTVPAQAAGGEANLIVPALNDPSVQFLGMTGQHLLMIGLLVCALGMAFGLMVF